VGIQPDILMCRADREIPHSERRKIALFCNVREERVIPGLDADTIYRVPLNLHEAGLDAQVCDFFGLETPNPDVSTWKEIVQRVISPEGEVTIAIVGKYTELKDAYKSLDEALTHGGIANNVKVNLEWMNAEIFEADDEDAVVQRLEGVHGILVPGGFGERGTEGKIRAVRFAREHNVPFFGICLGMQMAVVEAARNLAGIKGAGSTEFGPWDDPVVGLMTEWIAEGVTHRRDEESDKGGTMRLGAYECRVRPDTEVHRIYGADVIFERHRHRYEVNVSYKDALESAGLLFSGMSPDGILPEIVEFPGHVWFVGVQFHPELLSKPFNPHPLFISFIEAAVAQSRLV
ncbi:MAG: CTP synthase, partial [Rhodospirillales bacterium]|nr:CTP synthase [Rhodospirillales bacterium]